MTLFVIYAIYIIFMFSKDMPKKAVLPFSPWVKKFVLNRTCFKNSSIHIHAVVFENVWFRSTLFIELKMDFTFSLMMFMPSTHMASTFSMVPELPYLWNLHLVILNNLHWSAVGNDSPGAN